MYRKVKKKAVTDKIEKQTLVNATCFGKLKVCLKLKLYINLQ